MANNVMNMDGSFKPFRAWCQHVLPQVYDDSLSYMELLNKVITYINSFGEYLEEYTVINKIVYEGIWDITKNYKINSVVSDNGYGYLSMQAVPAGVPITATDYWLKIADFAGEIIDLGERVITLEGQMSQAEDDIDALESSMGTAQTDISGLKTRMTSAEGSITSMGADITKLQNTNSWLSGKKVVWYGDSWGTTANNIIDKFNAMYPDVDITNRCIGGTMLTRSNVSGFTTNSGYQRILAADDLNTFDYIFIMYGVNDWQMSLPLKTKSPSEYEYIYCVEGIINFLQENYPSCKPVFILQSYCYKTFGASNLDGINYAGVNQPGYINNTIELCEKYNVDYINLFELAGVTRRNYTECMRFDDPVYVHPTNATFAYLANIVYAGHLNTGKCYGDNWSENIAKNNLNLGRQQTYEAYHTLVPNVCNYPRVIVPIGAAPLTNTPVATNTVIHIRGYKDTTNINGIRILSKDGNNAIVAQGITNINKVNYIDCYIEFDYHEQYAILFDSISDPEVIYGLDIRFKNGGSDIYSIVAEPSVVTGITATLTQNFPTVIKNGVQMFKGCIMTTSGNVAGFADVLNMNVYTYANAFFDFPAFDLDSGECYPMYLYNGKARFRKGIGTGRTIIIPAFQLPVPQ